MPIQRRLALKFGADDDDRVVLAAPVALVEDFQVVTRNRCTDRVLERGLADGHLCRPSECRWRKSGSSEGRDRIRWTLTPVRC
jgi:hypothetical protein